MSFSHFISKKKSSLVFIFFFLLIAAVGGAWLLQSPTKEELFGNTGKITDWLHGGLLSWSPNYMLGGSMVIYHTMSLAIALAGFFIFLFGSLFGIFASLKLLLICTVMASSATMFLFVKKVTSDNRMSTIAALMMLAMPSLNVALGIYEHWTVALCFVFVPLILRGLLAVAETKAPREIVLLGLSAAAIALSYTKIAIVITPVLFLWSLEILRLHPGGRLAILQRYGISVMIATATALLILVPAFREFNFVAGMLLDPLDAWQHHYSLKTTVAWFDLWGFFLKGAGPDVTADAAMFGIGFLPLLAISLGLGLHSLEEWRRTSVGRWFLILVACWLVAIGFSAGLDGILMGHWNLLKIAQGLSNLSIPFLWLAFFWIAWVTYKTTYLLIGGPWWRSLAVMALFLGTPFFRLINIIPIFKNIRALECFWSVSGFCVLVAAVGIIAVPLFTISLPKRFYKIALIALALLFCLESYPTYSVYWTRGLPSEIFTEYNQALAFLKTAPLSGRVHPLSSRYFYLTIPTETGHALSSEALFHHFQLKWVRYLEAAGNANAEALKSYLNLAGVSYIFIDKGDPLTPQQVQQFYRSFYPVVFENQFFVILENKNSLYPAFLARNFVALPPKSYTLAPASLQLAPMNLATVEMPQVDQGMLGFAGMSKGSNQIELLPAYRNHGGIPFLHVSLTEPRLDDYNQMTYRVPPNASGWLIVTEAYHPDWRATIDGERTPVYCSESALLSVYIPIGSSEIVFKFVPPFWYSLLRCTGLLSWIALLGIFLFFSSKWAPPAWKAWWQSGA